MKEAKTKKAYVSIQMTQSIYPFDCVFDPTF